MGLLSVTRVAVSVSVLEVLEAAPALPVAVTQEPTVTSLDAADAVWVTVDELDADTVTSVADGDDDALGEEPAASVRSTPSTTTPDEETETTEPVRNEPPNAPEPRPKPRADPLGPPVGRSDGAPEGRARPPANPPKPPPAGFVAVQLVPLAGRAVMVRAVSVPPEVDGVPTIVTHSPFVNAESAPVLVFSKVVDAVYETSVVLA